MSHVFTETETVIKRIIPYLLRRGYELDDLDFETAVSNKKRSSKGYIDILVKAGKKKPQFLIEAKRVSKKLNTSDRNQALSYGTAKEVTVPFVVVTNGVEVQCYNTKTKERILWDAKGSDKIPTKSQLPKVLSALKTNPDLSNINLRADQSLPFRSGLPLRQLNALFYRCHSIIRKIEKNEEHAFADFSKLLFLKLLEEKSDIEPEFTLPYSYKFHELAEQPDAESDQVKTAVLSMINSIVDQTPYGDVLKDKLKLEKPRTYHQIIKRLSSVSFQDCSLDSKGASFEYFVRATLKGKKLGQYFTPRELVTAMLELVGREKITQSILSGTDIKVLDPACGTGGFLVFLMQDTISQLKEKHSSRSITKPAFDRAVATAKSTTFFGSDANDGVAGSAKMNMIISGDGHTNIQHEDSLSKDAENWDVENPDCDLILTNPPFGTSEADSLSDDDLAQYDIRTAKGQHLFLQKMVKATKPLGEICTVIDEGVLNTDSATDIRRWLQQQCRIKCVMRLPSETFKPNKINVRSSVLYLEKRENEDIDLEDVYTTTFLDIKSLGYVGSGNPLKGFDKNKFYTEIRENALDHSSGTNRSGHHWECFDISSADLVEDSTFRLDYKYWEPNLRKEIRNLSTKDAPTISSINKIETSRGISPKADSYVDEKEGYAIVLKAGSSITKFGTLNINEDTDWIEKNIYDEYLEKVDGTANSNIVKKGDVLVASTGDGTLGKACVYDLETPAIADGHITIIRPDKKLVDLKYLVDYLRSGFGAQQIARSYTGSTGLIELTPGHVDSIFIELQDSITEQKKLSGVLRRKEKKYLNSLNKATSELEDARNIFFEASS